MALPTYNAAKHHVGLKAVGGATSYGFMLEGGYVKEIQREKTGGAPDFGGQTDLIGQTPSLSRWTQDDFIGGMFAYNWGRDDAMFADCTNFMPAQQSRSLISCPPMVQVTTGLTGTHRSIFMVGGSIYVAAGGTLYRYQIGGGVSSYTLPGTDIFTFAEYDSQDQMIWTGNHVPGSRPLIRRIKTDLTDPSVDNVMLGPNNTTGWSFMGGTIFNQFIVCQIGRRLFVGDPPKNEMASISSTIKWRNITRLPGRWKDSLAYNNTLYILINDGSFRSSIYAFDGDTVSPIVTFPFNFFAKCLIEYAGRIFVGGTGTDVNGGEHYAELYEVTGASTRLVRSFAPETRNTFLGGVAGEWPQSFDDLVVHEGLLWMCQKGKKMVVYDVTSDGFFGAAEIQGDSSRNYTKMVSGRGRIWCLTSGGAIDRIAQPADSPSTWYPTFVTSDFTHEIAMLKNWSEIQVMSRYGTVVSIEYSVNSGGTWTSLSPTNTSSGHVHFSKASLAAITPSKIIRFRIKLTSTGDAGNAATWHRELVAFTVSFSMVNETKKRTWGITINGAREIETRDAVLAEATTQEYDVSEVRDQLWSWANAETNLTFRDLDGSDYTVKMEAFREMQPVIGPAVTETSDTQNEAQYAMTLLEV